MVEKKGKKEKSEKKISKSKTSAKTEKPPVPKETNTEISEQENKKPKSFLDGVKIIAKEAKKRKFNQTWELLVNVKDLNLKKPENRFNAEFLLPEGRGDGIKVAVIADTLEPDAKKYADFVLKKNEMEPLSKNKKKLKNIIDSYDFFYAEAPLMVDVGRLFGAVMGPRGKMAKPIPPGVKVEPFVKRAKRLSRIALRETPVIQIVAGKEDMDSEKVAKNMESAYNFILEKLPKGKDNVKSAYVKLTMSKPVRVI